MIASGTATGCDHMSQAVESVRVAPRQVGKYLAQTTIVFAAYFVAGKLGEEFRNVADRMESMSPKIVALSRLAKVAHRAELEDWVRAGYEKLEVSGYDGIYVRKDDR